MREMSSNGEDQLAPRLDSVRRIHLDAVDSTNRFALREIEAGSPLPFLVVADRQTGGRGRLGRTWVSPPGGLYLTLALRPLDDLPLSYHPLALSLAAAEALRARGVEVGLKWPNDIVVHGRKIAGLLAETAVIVNPDREGDTRDARALVLGIGINVNHSIQGKGILPEPASLADLTGRGDWDLGALREDLLAPFARHLRTASREGPEALHRSAVARSATLGRRVRILSAGTERTGRAVGLGEDLSLILEGEEGRFSVVVGDCELLRAEEVE